MVRTSHSAPDDDLKAGRELLESMMKEAKKTGSELTMDDKLKIIDRWIKFQALAQRAADRGMGRGFDDLPDED